MKILSITAQKPHSTGSGVYLSELVKNWDRDGHRQAVIAGVYRSDELCFPKGVELFPVYFGETSLPFAITGMSDEMPYASTRYSALDEGMLEQFEKAFYQAVSEAVEALSPDVIVCHHLYLLTALVREWYPKKKLIGICHGSDLRQLRKNPLLRERIVRGIGGLDRIIALQEAQKAEIMELFGVEEARIFTAGAGFDRDIFCPEKVRRDAQLTLSFAGKVSEKKGVKSLLRALSRLSIPEDALKVVIAGASGAREEYAEILALAKACRYPVSFPGMLRQTELSELFCRSDLFVLPSFFEGLPLVILEALACGAEVICSEIPGLRGWLSEKLPGHGITLIGLPAMRNVDEPEASSLPDYEERLAKAIEENLEICRRKREAIRKNEEEEACGLLPSAIEMRLPEGLSELSWSGVSRRILKSLFPEEK